MYRVDDVPFIEPADETLKYALRFPAGTLFRKTSIPDRLTRYKMGNGTGDYISKLAWLLNLKGSVTKIR